MREREQHALATTAAEAMYNLWEMESRRKEPDLDAMMRRLKDLSAYSLTHAEILEQREGVEMLALAMFFRRHLGLGLSLLMNSSTMHAFSTLVMIHLSTVVNTPFAHLNLTWTCF